MAGLQADAVGREAQKDLDLSQIQVAISSRCSPLDKDVRVTPSAVATPNHVRLCSVGIRRCVRPAAVVRASSSGPSRTRQSTPRTGRDSN